MVSNGAVRGPTDTPCAEPQLCESSLRANCEMTSKEPASTIAIRVTFQGHGNSESQFGFDFRAFKGVVITLIANGAFHLMGL